MTRTIAVYLAAVVLVIFSLGYARWVQPSVFYWQYFILVFLIPLIICGAASFLVTAWQRGGDYFSLVRSNLVFALGLSALIMLYFNLFFTRYVADSLQEVGKSGRIPWEYLLHGGTSEDTLLSVSFFVLVSFLGTYAGRKVMVTK